MPRMPSTRELIHMAQLAGYEVAEAQQLRANRWLLALGSHAGEVLLLVQARPLITAADVQDLAELVQLRAAASGILLAYGGAFSPAAQRTLAELAPGRLRLCTTLPPAPQPEAERVAASVVLRPTS